MRRAFGFPLGVALLCGAAAGAQEPATLKRGEVIPRVVCAGQPEQSYALYLPSNYTPAREWPVLLAFDPAGRGALPVRLLKDAAEEFGYIVAGSNNSRNGPARLQAEAAEAVMRDVASRLRVDPRRLYTAGFSGGARVAAMTALLCGDCIAGVIAQGGGFPANAAPSREQGFSFFAVIGDRDYNYPELFELHARLESLGRASRLRVFDGVHRWAPPEVLREAVEWMELRAMARGRRPRDAALIARSMEAAAARIQKLEAAGDSYAAWKETRALVQTFAGLADVAAFEAKVAAGKDTAGVRDGSRRERKELERQRALVAPFHSAFAVLRAEPGERLATSARLQALLSDLRLGAARTRDPSDRLAHTRALGQAYAHAIEEGEAALRERDLAFALAAFELARAAMPDSPGPPFLMARVHAAAGRGKSALNALDEAVRKGLGSAELLRETPEFAPLHAEPEFQRLLASLASPS
jgi:dienelactone hydrolase